MKLIKSLSKKAALIKICSFVLFMLLAFNCSEPIDNLVVIPDENVDVALKSAVKVTEPINLEGFSLFFVYAKMEKKLIVDQALVAKATFTHVDGQNYLLETQEWFGDLFFREITFEVKMTPSGVLEFSWPDTWLEFGMEVGDVIAVFTEHTGYKASGPGVQQGTIIYKGTFDGENFNASIHLTAKQFMPGTLPAYQEMVDGPIQLIFSFDLHKTN